MSRTPSKVLVFHSLFAAILLALSYPPTALWPLAFVSFIYVSYLLLKCFRSPREAAWFWGLFSFFTYILGFYWLGYTLHEFSSLNWVAVVPLTIAIFILFSLFSAFLGRVWGLRRSSIHSWKLQALLLFSLELIWEFLDPKLFPWSPVIAIGSHPLLLATATYMTDAGWKVLFHILQFSTALYLYRNEGSWKNPTVWLKRLIPFYGIVLTLFMLWGYWARAHLQSLHPGKQPIALIQGNIGNYEKKLVKLNVYPNVQNVLKIHRDLIDQASIYFHEHYPGQEPWVFWPETSFPGRPVQIEADQNFVLDWTRQLRGLQMLGSYEEAQDIHDPYGRPVDYNVAAFFHEKVGYVGHYRKNILVPFGEMIPWGETFPVLYKWMPYVPRFAWGKEPGVIAHPDPKGPVFVVVICYEILFRFLVDRFVKVAEERFPGRQIVLVNPTNDSWYGPTSEPFEHSLLARWAAATRGLALLRPTNTGLSQIIAPWGEVLGEGPRDESWVIYGELPRK